MIQVYHTVKIRTTAKASDQLDLISHSLFESGALGTQVNYAPGYLENHPNLFGEIPLELPKSYLLHQTEIEGYFTEIIETEALLNSLKEMFPEEAFEIILEEIPEENWQNNWMTYYQPEPITRFLTIVPVWLDYQARENEKIILLDPGMAFGTGNHPTTQLSIQALEIFMRGGERVIDVGTGSGILSFVADQFNASEVRGFDLDPQAVASAQKNLQLQKEVNGTITFSENDLLKGVEGSADIIVANILPHILVDLLDDAIRILYPKGLLILGGILVEKANELLDVIQSKEELTILQRIEYKNWVNFVVQMEVEEV